MRGESFQASEEALLGAARERTGLSDFGEDGMWREGLRVLLRGYDEEARLSAQGRERVREELVTLLAARLGVREGWRRDPACLENEIVEPVFILGFPRTGTTALNFLLAQDPANQVLEWWLASAPRPRPPRDTWEQEPDFQRAVEVLRLTYEQDPELRAIHLMEADGPEECRHLLAQSFVDDTFDSNSTLPSYTKWFRQQDLRPAYAWHRDVLKLVGSPTPERHWVLKYPAHMRQLDVVVETYPDARFVWTHRDPARLLPSLCSLVAGWRSLYESDVDDRAIGRMQLDMWSDLARAGMEARERLGPERFFDQTFLELVGDPVSAIRRAYAHFGRELSQEAEGRIRAWAAANPQGKHGGHRYTPERFGLSEEEIDERFAAYRERFGVAKDRPA